MLIMLVIVAVVYTLSPVDLFPGPVDDAIIDLAVLGIFMLSKSFGGFLREKGYDVKDKDVEVAAKVVSDTLQKKHQNKQTDPETKVVTDGMEVKKMSGF